MSARPITRLEELAPDITTHIAALVEKLAITEGEWYLLDADVTLWNEAQHGPLTIEGARQVEERLRGMVETALPLRDAPRLDRALALIARMREVPVRLNHMFIATTPALDRGLLGRASGRWEASITIGGTGTWGVSARAQKRAKCLDLLTAEARQRWSGTPATTSPAAASFAALRPDSNVIYFPGCEARR